MESWKKMYSYLVTVALIYGIYTFYLLSNIKLGEEQKAQAQVNGLINNQINSISTKLSVLEENQEKFDVLAQNVEAIIGDILKRPNPKIILPVNPKIFQAANPEVPNAIAAKNGLADLYVEKSQIKIQEIKVNEVPIIQKEPVLQNYSVSQSETQVHAPIPVLVIACNRPTVSRALDSILNARNHFDSKDFPILVSQDCGHQATKEMILKYKGNHEDFEFIQQPDLSNPPVKSSAVGYYKLSRHYKFALSNVFKLYPKSPAVIIIEDDLEVSPDIFAYFRSMSKLLFDEEDLYCVSAWNDNGKDHQIEQDPFLVYRTDFFGGLGWMLKRETWVNEWSDKWPAAYWDDWVRNPDQRKNRQCIRPEVPRTSTFGKVGVSNGQFFEQHLAKIHENHKWLDWSHFNITTLKSEVFEEAFLEKVENLPTISASEIKEISAGKVKNLEKSENAEKNSVKVIYETKGEFADYARRLQIMDDLKAGVPRGGYKGVVWTLYNDIKIYLSPSDPASWVYREQF